MRRIGTSRAIDWKKKNPTYKIKDNYDEKKTPTKNNRFSKRTIIAVSY